jgi:DNA-binding GntR family transcriptional regulator
MKRIVKESIGEQIYSILKEEILLAKRKPGEQINLRKLAEELGASIMPVRDALKQLVDEGLVIRKPRVGFFIRNFTRQEAEEIMEMRKIYELYCLDKYFDKIDREKLKIFLEKSLDEKNITQKTKEFDELDENIHDLLIKASGNFYLINSYNNIKNQIIILRHLIKDEVSLAREEHILLIKAILEGNKERAKEILENHINRVTNAIIELF